MSEEIVNKVAKSGLITLELKDFYPKGKRVVYDIKDNLWQGLALKEKDFRAFVKNHDWSQYKDCYVGLICSTDAIVPTWAYMLLSAALEPYAKKVVYGDQIVLDTILMEEEMAKIDPKDYEGERVIIKGCGDIKIPESAFVTITEKLKPVAKTIMYGEPCSTVPVYKRPRG